MRCKFITALINVIDFYFWLMYLDNDHIVALKINLDLIFNFYTYFS